MITIILITIIALFVILFIDKPIILKTIRPLVLPLFCITFILALVFYPKTSVSSALKGINICLNIVFPSLFPFLAASELLNKTSFIKAAGILLEPIMRPLFNVPSCGSFAVAMGITSGYPVGAKITVDLRNSGQISKQEGERLLSFKQFGSSVYSGCSRYRNVCHAAVGLFSSNMPYSSRNNCGTFIQTLFQ